MQISVNISEYPYIIYILYIYYTSLPYLIYIFFYNYHIYPPGSDADIYLLKRYPLSSLNIKLHHSPFRYFVIRITASKIYFNNIWKKIELLSFKIKVLDALQKISFWKKISKRHAILIFNNTHAFSLFQY